MNPNIRDLIAAVRELARAARHLRHLRGVPPHMLEKAYEVALEILRGTVRVTRSYLANPRGRDLRTELFALLDGLEERLR